MGLFSHLNSKFRLGWWAYLKEIPLLNVSTQTKETLKKLNEFYRFSSIFQFM